MFFISPYLNWWDFTLLSMFQRSHYHDAAPNNLFKSSIVTKLFFFVTFFFLHKIVCFFSSQICPFCCHKIVFLVTKLIVFWVNSVRSDNPNPNFNRKLAPVYFSGLLVKESTTDQNNGLQYLQHKDLFIFLFLIPSFHQTFA